MVWQITEPLSFFLGKIVSPIDSSLPQTHQLTKACSRYLINLIFEQNVDHCLKYTPKGKPLLNDLNAQISISHSKEWVAVYIDLSDSGESIGIDIEGLRNNLLGISKKFVGPQDFDPQQNPENALLIWSSKEVLYKIYAEKSLDFKTHLSVQIHPQLAGQINIDSYHKQVALDHQMIEDKLLVWSL